ncbi:MAG: cell wall hydrolase [Gammaproteobacteria bacterium]|nr:cell wall hydrolase [Gammaproteobacteria bacterium]MDH5729269.1 cell wall hydrolase [Gammaproteobacteria bacterium]
MVAGIDGAGLPKSNKTVTENSDFAIEGADLMASWIGKPPQEGTFDGSYMVDDAGSRIDDNVLSAAELESYLSKKDVKMGAKHNPNVAVIQYQLGMRGDDVDGSYGPKTHKAIAQYRVDQRVQNFTDDRGQIDYGKLLADKDFRVYTSTIAGEAIGQGVEAQKMIANIINNRVFNSRDGWKGAQTPIEVLRKGGFDALDYKTGQYKQAMGYFESDVSSNKRTLDNMVKAIAPIYLGKGQDSTDGSVLYFSPNTQLELYFEGEISRPVPDGKWNAIEEVYVPGVTRTEDFMIFKYK